MVYNISFFSLISAYTTYLVDTFVDDFALANNLHLLSLNQYQADSPGQPHKAEAKQTSLDSQPSSDDLPGGSLSSTNSQTPREPSVDVVESALPSDAYGSPPVLNGRLKIRNRFGDGGYSAVHLGELKSGNETLQVAVKLFLVDLGDEADFTHTSRRIAREVKLINELSHPNLVKFYGICTDATDLGVSELTPALVTGLCEGRTIEKYLRKHPDTLRLPLMLDAALGLEYMHSRDVVHGDLKPDNILVTFQGNKVKAVIGDFGRSRICNRRGFTTNLATTMAFAAPEFVVDEDSEDSDSSAEERPVEVTKPSDVYSFGLTLLTVVSGKLPFNAKCGRKIFVKLVVGHERPRRSHHESPEINDDVWQLMEECWPAEPDARLEMKDVAVRLRRIVRGDN